VSCRLPQDVPGSSTARATFSRVSSEKRPVPRTTFDTVRIDTPACSATSLSLTASNPPIGLTGMSGQAPGGRHRRFGGGHADDGTLPAAVRRRGWVGDRGQPRVPTPHHGESSGSFGLDVARARTVPSRVGGSLLGARCPLGGNPEAPMRFPSPARLHPSALRPLTEP